MIILPGTPFVPHSKVKLSKTLPELAAARTQLTDAPLESHHDLISFLNLASDYLDSIILFTNSKDGKLLSAARASGSIVFAEGIPWNGIMAPKLALGKKPSCSWTLLDEMCATAASMSLCYSLVASKIIDDLVETEPTNLKETAESWTPVIKQYKNAASLASFGQECLNYRPELDLPPIDPQCFSLLEKTAHISTQISMLVKSSWLNRLDFNRVGSFTTKNNGTLSRVAVYIVDELKFCQKLVQSFDSRSIVFRYEDWFPYLKLMECYATAYSVLFLSIDYYQQQKVGLAIGLLNFGLLTLQAKNINNSGKDRNLITRFKTKLTTRKNELYIKDLQSVTTLNLNKLHFKSSSGAFLKDLEFLFDQLVQLHLKFTKENDNLLFDPIVDWQDAKRDSKWPTGAAIPTSATTSFRPPALNGR